MNAALLMVLIVVDAALCVAWFWDIEWLQESIVFGLAVFLLGLGTAAVVTFAREAFP